LCSRLASRSGVVLSAAALHIPTRARSEPHNSAHYEAKSHSNIVVATHNANSPTEDRHLVHQHTGWNVCAVFDGHGGWQVADYASKSFFGHLIPRLIHLRPDMHNDVANAIERTFESVEEGYTASVLPAYKLGFGDVGKVGSCALLAVQKGRDLYLGNCGDCRAVLCTSISVDSNNSSATRVVATRLTRDHNARTPIEALLLRQAHPNEPDIVICKNPHACYVKGRLQLTRALGDLYLKVWSYCKPLSCTLCILMVIT
jgi:pyruvate dehydrogenase phosphatase